MAEENNAFKKAKKLTNKNIELQNAAHEFFNKLKIADFLNLEKESIQEYFPLKKEKQSLLKIAIIADEFTINSYKHECELLELSPSNYKNEIDSFNPDLLFIESAWNGKDKLWYKKIANGSSEVFALIDYARLNAIPTVFSNKEDPVYTDTFMCVAQKVDYVFTTDFDCIYKYKKELGHNRVYHLHFAAQCKLHNPIEKFERKHKACFAGSYYHRYPNRTKVFDSFVNVFQNTIGIDIYDRLFGNPQPEFAFPKAYNSLILGNLKTEDIDKAYKAYIYGINSNSIQQSQTMFARRVFELMASNTVVLSNYSRGLKNYFGDLCINTDNNDQLEKAIKKFESDIIYLNKFRLKALRTVLKHHSYDQRLDYIVQKVFGKSIYEGLAKISVIAKVDNQEQADSIMAMFNKQSYDKKELLIVCNNTDILGEGYKIIKPSDESLNAVVSTGFIAYFDYNSYYGKHYLEDIALATKYAQADSIGKHSVFSYEDKIKYPNFGNCYKYVNSLLVKSAMFNPEKYPEINLNNINSYTINTGQMFAIDSFNYCHNSRLEHHAIVEDISIADCGIPIDKIQNISENIVASTYNNTAKQFIIPLSKCDKIKLTSNKNISTTVNMQGLTLNVCDMPNKAEICAIIASYNISDYINNGKISIYFEGFGNMSILGIAKFYDSKNKLISKATSLNINQTNIITVPNNSVKISFELEVLSKGVFTIKAIKLSSDFENSSSFNYLPNSDTLIISDKYPEYDDLYRYMFLHQRLKSYKDEGLVTDFFCLGLYSKNGFREFDGINVFEGHSQQLYEVLSTGKIKTIGIHFLNPQIWSVIKNFADDIRIIIWLHGSEVQPWQRRVYNYENSKDLEAAKLESQVRQKFWHEVFSFKSQIPIHYVFVSQYFANEVMQDNNVKLDNYSIIHNCIDTNTFSYIPKTADQRFKILSIKSYGNRKYGNDITSNAIVELSKNPIFNKLQFSIYGDGIRFNEDTRKLKKFKNVSLNKTYINHDRIKQLHKENGIFIATTRMDAQGVSRDEAMSSGMVPIANNVTAIPEFVDSNCGMLVEAEDYVGVANAIIELVENPELFLKLSKNAALRVRNQTSFEFTIKKEIELIKHG